MKFQKAIFVVGCITKIIIGYVIIVYTIIVLQAIVFQRQRFFTNTTHLKRKITPDMKGEICNRK